MNGKFTAPERNDKYTPLKKKGKNGTKAISRHNVFICW